MDRSLAGLIGAAGALAAAGSAQAAPGIAVSVESALHASSYADLLKPIPNALALRAAFAEQRAAEAVAAPAEGEVLSVQYYYHHHHHHHHRYYRRRYYHHHHHHHHSFYR